MNCLRVSSISEFNIFDLTPDQYDAFNIITSAINGTFKSRGAWFFVTGPGGTGKSYLLQALEYWFKGRGLTYLKMAPTGIAAVNIGGQTIHSALMISPKSINSNYQSLISKFEDRLQELCRLNILIIDEISMVDGNLFDFISQLFRWIQRWPEPFGNIHLICFSDLMQLPPVSGIKVFKSNSWWTLFPLFLTTCRRQKDDQTFASLLNNIRFGRLTASVKNALSQKYQHCTVRDHAYLTTYIVSHRSEAHRLNQLLLDNLQTGQQIQYHATDYEENQIIHGHSNTHTFSRATNLPDIVTLAIGAKVMYLTNTLLSQGICNGSCGVITAIELSTYPVVAFPTPDGIKVINSHFLSIFPFIMWNP